MNRLAWKPETYRPIIVVLTGRTGSSTVARLLQEEMGVKMVAQQFIKEDEWNPKGYYEDRQVKHATKKLMAGDWPPPQAATHLFRHYGSGAVPWGFKFQPLGEMPEGTLQAFNPSRVIACVRGREMTVGSIQRWRNWNVDYEKAADRYDMRSTAMKKLLHGFAPLWLDFSVPRKEHELVKIMREFIGSEIEQRRKHG